MRTARILRSSASSLGRIALVVVLSVLSACSGGDDPTARENPQPAPPVDAAPPPGPIVGTPAPPSATCGDADFTDLKTAVFVSASGADGANCGQTTATACKTIQQGIDRCSAAGCAVLIRHGMYSTQATVTLRDAVDVYGSCLFDGEADRKYRTVILANPEPGTPALSASGINTPTKVQGLFVLGKDEKASGTASIAMAVSASKGLALSRNMLVAGRGGDGASIGAASRGEAGGDGSAPGCSTCRGAAGNACPSNPPPAGIGSGGAGAAQNEVFTSGCVGNCACATNNPDSSSGLAGQNSGRASGGGGAGKGSSGCSCFDRPSYFGTVDPSQGPPGGAGGTGECSTQGGTSSPAVWGTAGVSAATWTPAVGGTGASGNPGAGGGGGGSGGYATRGGSPYDLSGYPGGGGGGGGCGGPGGAGGQQGGASIALVLTDSTVADVATTNSLVAGPGGNGGNGGQGGPGGPGGSGGPGFRGPQFNYLVVLVCAASQAPGFGGTGGNGGQGGAGSGGAGGNGGPSIGIALLGNSPAPASIDAVYPGKPGSGGGAGSGGINPNCTGGVGSPGVGGGAAPTVKLDDPASSVLSAGQSLRQGESRTSANGINLLILQTDGNFCLYKSGVYQWCSEEARMNRADEVVMQTDGNLCLLTGQSECTNTAGHPGAYLIVRDDGRVAIQDGPSVLWTIP